MWVVIQPPTDPHSTCCCIRPVTCPALWRRLCYSPVGPKYAVQLLMGSQGTVYGDANHGHHISVRINCIMKRHDIYVIGFCIVLTKTFCSFLANQLTTIIIDKESSRYHCCLCHSIPQIFGFLFRLFV